MQRDVYRFLAVFVLAMAAVLVVAPAAQASPWLMAGQDPARTGDTGAPALDHLDLAFRTELPAEVPPGTAVVIANGSIYVPTQIGSGGSSDRGFQGIVRVDLATGQTAEVAALEAPTPSIASDGERLFVFDDEAALAVSMETGEVLWETPEPRIAAENPTEGTELILDCPSSPAVHEGRLYVACEEERHPDDRDQRRVETSFVWALDTETGETQWTWHRQEPRPEERTQDPPTGLAQDPTGAPVLSAGDLEPDQGNPAVLGDHVVLPFVDGRWVPDREGSMTEGSFTHEWWYELVSLDRASGELEWTRNTTAGGSWNVEDPSNQTGGVRGGRQGTGPYSFSVTGDAGAVFTREGDQAIALNPGQRGALIWQQAIGQEDPSRAFSTVGPALGGDELYLSSAQTLYRFNASTGSITWSHTLEPDRQERFATSSHVLTEGSVLALTNPIQWGSSSEDGGISLISLDRGTGDVAWRYETLSPEDPSGAGPFYSFAVGDGIVAIVGSHGNLTVLGHTGASIQPTLDASSQAPGVGEPVTVDLSGTEPGIDGPPSAYRAEWGDGNTTGWQEDPVFEHTYEDEGEKTATFHVRNDEGQTATQTQTFRVGHSEPNLLEEAFRQENQDMTFGILGVALALGGGAIGVTRRRRRRTRLQDELEAVEQAYEETKDRPAECEAQLTERKTHARGLMLDGQLTEEQFRVVEDRIEELARELRLSTVEEFDFLPHRLLTELRGVLEDGEITEMEKEGILHRLEEDDMLTGEYKERVRSKVEEWYERDARR